MGALNGLKILDFSTLLPGPFASLMLADMGAEVLKISSASRPMISFWSSSAPALWTGWDWAMKN